MNKRINEAICCCASTQHIAKRVAQALLFLTIINAAAASTVTVSGTSQSAVTSAVSMACNGTSPGTVVFPNGTYNITSTITVPANCTLQGQTRRQATLSGNNAQILALTGNNIAIDGLVFNGGLIYLGGGPTSQFVNFTFTNNTVQNFTAACGGNCGPGVLYAQALKNSLIDSNVFSNLWPGGWPSTPDSSICLDCWGPTAIRFYSIDQTAITNNTFDKVASDSIAIDFETTLGATFPGGPYTTTGNVIAYNTFSHQRRIPVEVQTLSSGVCPDGACAQIPPTTGIQIKGNFAHNWSYPYGDSWLSLVPDGSTYGFDVNNTWIANIDPEGHSGTFSAPCQETSGNNVVVQGTVCAAASNIGSSWSEGFAIGAGASGTSTTIQNTVECVNSSLSANFETPAHNTLAYQYNYLNPAACAVGNSAIDQSGMLAAFASTNSQSFPNGGNGNWSISVISNLSIKWVNFFLDGANSPIVTQELADVNNNFANDRKWLYHAAINTSVLAAGTHTLQAQVTDVSGAVQTLTQTFQVGSTVPSGVPGLSISTATLQFGSQQLNTSSASQPVTLANTGSGTLNITAISVTGTNAADFSRSSGCGASLAAGASCTVNVVFTPTASGARSATLTITDNAASSSQSVSLSGAAVTSAPQSGPGSSVPVNQWLQIISKNSGKCLGIPGGPTVTASVQLEQWTCGRWTNQLFMLSKVNGGYEITVKSSGLQLDVSGGPGATQDGAPIIQYPFWGGSNEIWTLTSTPDGYYTIHPLSTGKCVDESGMSTANGALVTDWSCWGGANQSWQLMPVQ